MKNSKILVMMLTVLAFAACQKEDNGTSLDGRLVFKIEGNDNTKTTITHRNDSSIVAWVTGDSVRINDKVLRVVYDDGTASAANPFDGMVSNFYAVYPSTLCNGAVSSSVTLNLPAEYTYAVSDGKQNLKTPMVAYAPATAKELVFKHVTAAIGVEVKNYHDYAITVDQITITSNSYKINGSVSISLGNEITVSPQTTETASEKTVTMNFDGGTTLTVPAGQTAIVQVPVLPVGDGNKFTVSVQVSKTSPDVTATLSRTQTTGGSLARAKMGYARYTLGGPFSVSSTKKVVFSKGNLQYNAAATTKWRFAENQYDYIGANNTNIAADYDGWIDLFGWGTGDSPTKHTTTGSDYSTFNEWGDSISGGWYTLSKSEWVYLTTGSRSNKTSGLTGTNSGVAKYTKATVNNVKGAIIFPDYYVHPSDANESGTHSFNMTTTAYNKFEIADGWGKMELAGAIFLPAAGSRNGTTVSDVNSTGGYWSSTKYNSSKGYLVSIGNYAFSADNYSTNAELFKGNPVRLVRDVQ